MDINYIFIIIGLDLSISIGYYAVHHLFLTKGFIQRLKRFLDALNEEYSKDVKLLLKELKKQTDISSPEDIVNHIDAWMERHMMVRNTRHEYDTLFKVTMYAIIAFLLSIGAAILEAWYPSVNPFTPPYGWMTASLVLMFIGIAEVFNYILKLRILESRISKFELGIPIKKIIEEDLQESED